MGSFHFYITFLVFLLSDHAVGPGESKSFELNVKRDDHKHEEHGDIGHMFDETRVRAHSQSEKDAILEKHRLFRGRTRADAADMEYMIWNEDLATLAGLWASVCYPGHGLPAHALVDNFDSIGQNIWTGGNKPTGIDVVQTWKSEKKNYNEDTDACKDRKICTHYSQIIWAHSKELGCSRAKCATTIDKEGNPGTKTNIWIEVCLYAPGGNTGKPPYQSGPPCTKCVSGKGLCYENACRDCSASEGCECKQVCHKCGTKTSDCTCACEDGWSGTDCSTECKDTHRKCMGEWKPYHCTLDHVKKGCPVMCGQCEPPTTCAA